MKNRTLYSEKFNELTREELKLLDKAAILVKKFVELSPKYSKTNFRTRDVHAKAYANIYGTFKLSDLSDDNIKQLFPKKEYTVVARISNAAMQVNDEKDGIPAYGFALKFLKFDDGVELNLPMVNFPLFPTNSVSKFLKFFISLNQYKISKIKYGVFGSLKIPVILMRSGFLIPDFLKQSFIKNAFKTVMSKQKNPLAFTYHSVGCYRMGDFMVKYLLEADKNKILQKKIGEKSQKLAVTEVLNNNQLVYSLKIQYCRNEEWVNDLSKVWPKKKYVEIGKITIAPNSYLNSEKAEPLSYNPFENPDNLKPVGKMQQTREKMYDVSTKARRIII